MIMMMMNINSNNNDNNNNIDNDIDNLLQGKNVWLFLQLSFEILVHINGFIQMFNSVLKIISTTYMRHAGGAPQGH